MRKIMMNMIYSSQAKEAIVKRLMNVLKGQAMYVKDDNMITEEQRNIQLKIVLDLAEYLKYYDRNQSILNKFLEEHKINFDDYEK